MTKICGEVRMGSRGLVQRAEVDGRVARIPSLFSGFFLGLWLRFLRFCFS